MSKQKIDLILRQSYFLSRRAFLRTMAAAGGVLATGSSITACAPVAPTSSGGVAPAAQSEQAGPKIGGTYRLVGTGDIRSLDPPAAESSEDWWSAGMVLYNCLFFYTKEGAFYADLAAEDVSRAPTLEAVGARSSLPACALARMFATLGLDVDDDVPPAGTRWRGRQVVARGGCNSRQQRRPPTCRS